MQPIPLEFQEGRFVFTQVRREGMWAIYRQTHRDGPMTRYEVVRLHVQRAHTWPNGQTTPEKEAFPAASAWGQQGWTCFTLPEAEALCATLQHPEGTP
jgi:hypothetical protein